jgi:hypothetical protein
MLIGVSPAGGDPATRRQGSLLDAASGPYYVVCGHQMSEVLSRPQALKQIIRAGVEPPLLAAGFERAGKTSWVRHCQELDHMVGLPAYYDRRHIQWGIVCPEAVAFLWDKPPRIVDVGWSVVTGTPGRVGRPAACGSFHLDEENSLERIEALAAAVAADMLEVEERMRPFSTRR